jgi:hypothetical protein
MFRIDDPSAATALPVPEAPGTEGYFIEGDPVAGTPATLVRGSFLNMIQEELRAIVVAGGLVPSKTTYNQVLAAIRALGKQSVLLADTGAVNAYAAVNPTPLVAGTWVNGVVQQVTIAHTNTGASTYAPDGLTAIPIYGLGLLPLQGNELLLNGTAILMKATIAGVNSGNPICVLLECLGGAQQVAPATQSGHAMQLGQATGRLLRTSVYTNVGGTQYVSINGGAATTTGATTFSSLALTTIQRVSVYAAGASGGAAPTTTSGIASAGGGGGGGGWAISLLAPTSGSVVVGAGGASVSSGSGNNGGSSSFGASLSATGGRGGNYSAGLAFPGAQVGGLGGVGTGGNICNGQGTPASPSMWPGSSVVISGSGGGTPLSGGAPGILVSTVTSVAGSPGAGPGAGGSGGVSNSGGAAASGGAGAAGAVIVEEYA